MQPTNYPHIDMLLDTLLTRMQGVLGDKLIGLYLYGSLVTGDFDDHLSDIDLLAAIASELTPAEADAIIQMHAGIVRESAQWDNRIEVAYNTLHGLRMFKTERGNLGIISPGEPFHIVDAGDDWLVNWYFVQVYGVTLFGVPPTSIITPVSKREFLDAVKAHILAWREYINDIDHRPGQAYAILTMCRGLYTVRHGEHVSKRKAAEWAIETFPEWATLITNALAWRLVPNEPNVDHAATLEETRRFVQFAIGEMEREL